MCMCCRQKKKRVGETAEAMVRRLAVELCRLDLKTAIQIIRFSNILHPEPLSVERMTAIAEPVWAEHHALVPPLVGPGGIYR